MPVRVLIADDAEVVRRTVRKFLECEPAIDVCGEASTFPQTLELATSLKPDVIILDIHMPDGDGTESASVQLRLLCKQLRILGMSLWQDEETQIAAECYGAVELLDKANLCDELIPAIQRVSRQHAQDFAADA